MDVFMNKTVFSIAYQAGLDAKKLGIPIMKTAIKNLRYGTPQYEDFLAGFDSYKYYNAEKEFYCYNGITFTEGQKCQI